MSLAMKESQKYPALPTWELLSQHDRHTHIDQALLADIAYLKANEPRWLTGILRPMIRWGFSDPALSKFHDFSWSDAVDLVTEQTLMCRQSLGKPQLSKHLQPAMSEFVADVDRRFAQQPCTSDTTRRRVDKAEELCSYQDPILVLGDDDCVSIELARRGFEQVTVFDIDARVIKILRTCAKRERLSIRAHVHDLSQAPDSAWVDEYRLVFLDPMYSYSGLKLFFQGARACLKPQSSHKAHYFLSFHLMSLARGGLGEFPDFLQSHGLELLNWYHGFNVYPTPKSVQRLLPIIYSMCIRRPSFLLEGAMLPYFSSDALVLTDC